MREDQKLWHELNDLAARETAERLRLAAALVAIMREAANDQDIAAAARRKRDDEIS